VQAQAENWPAPPASLVMLANVSQDKKDTKK
jgi:hypothetical protein